MTMTADQAATTGPEGGHASSLLTPVSSRVLPVKRPLMLHTGRLAVASVGALALVAALVTLVLGILGVLPILTPVVCLAVTAASVVSLRGLAIRARRARVQQAFIHAMSPLHHIEPVALPVASAPQRPTSLFDAEASASPPLTPMQLRTAALASAGRSTSLVAVESPPTAVAAPAIVSAPGGLPAGATAWAPVELPRPTYVDAAKAERQAPAPLELPEAPRPSTNTSIKTAEAAAHALSALDEPGAMTGSTGPATGRINLDDVLQRRRA